MNESPSTIPLNEKPTTIQKTEKPTTIPAIEEPPSSDDILSSEEIFNCLDIYFSHDEKNDIYSHFVQIFLKMILRII